MAIFGRNKKADELETASIEERETAGLSQGQIVFKRFLRHRAAMISVFYLTFIVLFVFSAHDGSIGPFDYSGWWQFKFDDVPDLRVDGCDLAQVGCPTLDVDPFFDGDGMELGMHPFGQDDIGRDYFALTMSGAQRSIVIMILIGSIGAVLGTIIGSISGFFRGWVDAILMRLLDFVITIPVIIVGAVIGYRVGNLGIVFLGFFLGLFAWPGLARLVRGEFLTLREREFVDAARVAGASNRRIVFKHILPNAVGVIIVSVTLLLSGAILLETGLSYLGFGVVAPDVSLGLLISQYQDYFSLRPWLFWWPGFFIISIALSINFIGDGLRDAFDPRQKRRITRKDRERAVSKLAETSQA